jgi:hypothetical protein
VRWSVGYSARADGDTLTAGDVFFPSLTATAPAADVLEVTTVTSTALTRSGGLYHLRASRVGADAADTLTNDVSLIGFRLRRAT